MLENIPMAKRKEDLTKVLKEAITTESDEASRIFIQIAEGIASTMNEEAVDHCRALALAEIELESI